MGKESGAHWETEQEAAAVTAFHRLSLDGEKVVRRHIGNKH